MFGIRLGLPIGLLGPHQDRRDFHETLVLIWDKDNAPPADALAVTPLPLDSLQGLYVSTKGVFRHFIQAFEEKILVISRRLAKLFCGGF